MRMNDLALLGAKHHYDGSGWLVPFMARLRRADHHRRSRAHRLALELVPHDDLRRWLHDYAGLFQYPGSFLLRHDHRRRWRQETSMRWRWRRHDVWSFDDDSRLLDDHFGFAADNHFGLAFDDDLGRRPDDHGFSGRLDHTRRGLDHHDFGWPFNDGRRRWSWNANYADGTLNDASSGDQRDHRCAANQFYLFHII